MLTVSCLAPSSIINDKRRDVVPSPNLIFSTIVEEEVKSSEHPRRRHYAALVVTWVHVVSFSVDLNINDLDRINLRLFLWLSHGWCMKSAESLEDLLIDHDAEPIARGRILLHSMALNPCQELPPDSCRRSSVKILVVDDDVAIAFPDLASRSTVQRFLAIVVVRSFGFLETLVFDPLVDNVEGSCKSRI